MLRKDSQKMAQIALSLSSKNTLNIPLASTTLSE
jgi:hypothetical protein